MTRVKVKIWGIDWDMDAYYEVVKHETKDYWYVWNLMKNEEVCDEDGEPYHFDSLEEAKQYIKNLKDLSNE